MKEKLPLGGVVVLSKLQVGKTAGGVAVHTGRMGHRGGILCGTHQLLQVLGNLLGNLVLALGLGNLRGRRFCRLGLNGLQLLQDLFQLALQGLNSSKAAAFAWDSPV